ncbi:MAG TPA: chemotaxis protein CheB [Vicinamibacterales bacterium]|nr:chemotaxis protein CheB [Vicinamibacterales bacterium]
MSATAAVSTTSARTDDGRPVRVIAVGASAGGLEALTQLLGRLPADSGLAYVLVQHLDPAHESILAELLARATTIPVMQATDGQRVEADHAYVIPPGVQMTLADGHLKLAPRERTSGPARSIDVFFRSVADVHGNDAVGVVLSGTGSDGALGLEAIKAAGGTTFAQNPASAGYDGMPRAAAATGCVDFVLPPADIATHLTRIGRPPGDRPPDSVPATQSAAALAPILDIVRQRTGVDFAQYKIGTVQRRVLRRMVMGNADAFDDYVELLQRNAAEVDALYADLLISVTRFFRDPDLFAVLSKSIFPELLKRREPNEPIRVWVPGCATGQEAYSVAISIVESLGNSRLTTPIQVFATDLSDAAIASARAGLYPHAIETDLSPERLRRFFVREAHGYRVAKAIRELCVFAPQNITSDPPFSQLDLISCRNVLIYLQPNLHERIFALFHYALKPGGILVLGNSESVGVASAMFAPLDKHLRVYARQKTPGRPHYLNFPASRKPNAQTVLSVKEARRTQSATEPQRAADQIVLGTYAPAGVVVDDQLQVVQFRGRTGAYLEPAAGTASYDLLGMVRHDLRAELRAAINTARRDADVVRAESIPVHDDAGPRYVDLEVIPFKVLSSAAQFFVVLFEDVDRAIATRRRARERRVRRRSEGTHGSVRRMDGAGGDLAQELDAAQRQLQEIADEHGLAIGELQAANEEVQSANEELQSTNEELETAKEELQSANEELATLNDELRARNGELGTLNDDLTNLLTSMHIPAVIVGTDLRIRRFTAGAERLMNIVPSDVGRRIGDLHANVDVPDLEKLIAEVVTTLAVREREVRDTRGCWYSMLIRPYKTAEQMITGVVIVYQDIDERKHHAEQIDEARRYAEAIIETVREPLLVIDASFQVQRANRAFYEMFQTTAAETGARSLFELGDGQWDIPPMRRLLEDVVRSETGLTDVEVEHVFPAIGRRVVMLNGRRIAFDGGSAPLILLAIQDITARRDFERRERFLTEATGVFARSVGYDATIEAIASIAVPAIAEWCIVDVSQPDGAVLRAEVVYHEADPNGLSGPAATRVAIAPEHPVATVIRTGQPLLLEDVPPSYLESGAWVDDDLVRVRALDPRSIVTVPLRSGDRILGAITLASTRSGSARRFSRDDLVVAEEFARRATLAIEAATHYRDMATARLVAEAANRAKSEFLATMSHELRTPLNAILGYVQIMQLEINGPVTEAQRKHLRRIEESQRHLHGLIEDVLAFAKIEAGHVDLQLTDLTVHEVLAEATALASVQMQRKELRYEYTSCDAAVLVHADGARVRQVVLNLLSNAMKFTDAGGLITLACVPAEADVIIRVADTGIGIPQDKLELIFQPFVQLDSTLTRKADGTGLGLAISRSFAREMGGDLTATSVVGKGSVFSLRLPRCVPPTEGRA